MTVPELVLALAAPADALRPSTTAETAATEANLIPLICSPHGRGRAGAVTSYRRGADLSAEIHQRRYPRQAPTMRCRCSSTWATLQKSGWTPTRCRIAIGAS